MMAASPHPLAAFNRRRAVMLLTAVTAAFLPFAAAVSYAWVRAILYLTNPSAPAPTPIPLVAACTMIAASVFPILHYRLAASPLRLLSFCGPISFRTPAQDARDLLHDLATRAGIPVPRLYVLEAAVPNALAAGVDPSHAIVVVTRGMLELLEKRELETVLAGEVVRIASLDIRWNAAVAAISVFLHLPFLLLRAGGGPTPAEKEASIRSLAIASLPMAPAILFATAPIVELVRALAPKGRDMAVDKEAVELTSTPDALMTTLAKIWSAGTAMPKSDGAVAHMFFADPVGRSSGAIHLRVAGQRATIKERITTLSHNYGGIEPERIDASIQAGEEFSDRSSHTGGREFEPQNAGATDAVFLGENSRSSRAYRVASAGDVFESPDTHSGAVAHVAAGDLVIVFQETGSYRQVVTSNGTFGFLPKTTKLEKTDHLAPDVFQQNGEATPEPLMHAPKPSAALSRKQVALVTAFGAAVFVVVLLLQTLTR